MPGRRTQIASRQAACAALALLLAAASTACTYRVREANVVIARVAPAVDAAALGAQFPDYRVEPLTVASAQGAELRGVRLLRPDAVATVLYFGGNGYTVSRYAAETVARYRDAPVSIVLVDHRGYGGSSGTPSLDLLLSDGVSIHDRLRGDPALGRTPIVAHGHSLGSFMAGHLAASRPLAGVVLESTVTTSEDWTAHLRSKQRLWVRLLVRRVIPDGGLAGKGNRPVVATLDEPVLFVTGADDDVAPPRFAQALFDATPLPAARKRLLIVPGRGHRDATDSAEYRAAFRSFLSAAVAAEAGSAAPHAAAASPAP